MSRKGQSDFTFISINITHVSLMLSSYPDISKQFVHGMYVLLDCVHLPVLEVGFVLGVWLPS